MTGIGFGLFSSLSPSLFEDLRSEAIIPFTPSCQVANVPMDGFLYPPDVARNKVSLAG